MKEPMDTRIRVCLIDEDAGYLHELDELIGGTVILHTAETFDGFHVESYDVILLDLNGHGIPLLDTYFKTFGDAVPVIVLADGGEQSFQEEAIKHGAYDFVRKGSITRPEPLLRLLTRAKLSKYRNPDRTIQYNSILERINTLNTTMEKTLE